MRTAKASNAVRVRKPKGDNGQAVRIQAFDSTSIMLGLKLKLQCAFKIGDI